tara:strand:+ start:405 stop:1301 length:897 start_codon:yes stop_codon:yes gene_type:complete
MKIVSLIPSATEIIYSLNLEEHLIGVSHECDYPKDVQKLPKLTKSKINISKSSIEIDRDINKILKKSLSVYEVNTKLLKKLDPDIIITQSQCSVCAVSIKEVKKSLEQLINKKPILIDLKANKFNDVLKDIRFVGEKLNKRRKSNLLVKKMKDEVKKIKTQLLKTNIKNVLCIEWIEPLMIAGNWVPELVKFAGGKCILSEVGLKSNFVKTNELLSERFEIVIFMPCGFNIKRSKKEIMKSKIKFTKIFKEKKVFIVDGNKYFNRPGPDLLESIRILAEIINPDIFPSKPNIKRWIPI